MGRKLLGGSLGFGTAYALAVAAVYLLVFLRPFGFRFGPHELPPGPELPAGWTVVVGLAIAFFCSHVAVRLTGRWLGPRAAAAHLVVFGATVIGALPAIVLVDAEHQVGPLLWLQAPALLTLLGTLSGYRAATFTPRVAFLPGGPGAL